MSTLEGTEVAPRMGAPAVKDRRLGLALLVIAAAQCLLIIDGTIVFVALPSIQSALQMPLADLNWVITAYALTFGGLLLVAGRAGDKFGRKKMLRIGLIVFALASLLGGLATSGEALIAARALQGIGAAIAAPSVLSLLVTTFPAGPARTKALGVYGAMGGIGSVIGLLLGGALTSYISWRWVLFVNIPIAIIVLVGVNQLIDGARDRVKIDLPGAITATLGLGSLVFSVNRVSGHGWSDGGTLGFLVLAGVLLIAFLVIQRSSRESMVPTHVLKERGRAGANIIMLVTAAGMFATYYFLTLYMQQVQGYSPMQTGLMYLPFALGFGIAGGGLAPQLLSRTSERTTLVTGLLMATVGMVWFSMLTPDSSIYAVLLPAQLVTGLGLGVVFVAATSIGVRGVASADTGIASGLLTTGLQIGGALGLAILATVASKATSGEAPGTATADALTHGYTVGFLVAGAFYLASLIIAILTIRPLASSKAEGVGESARAGGNELMVK